MKGAARTKARHAIALLCWTTAAELLPPSRQLLLFLLTTMMSVLPAHTAPTQEGESYSISYLSLSLSLSIISYFSSL